MAHVLCSCHVVYCLFLIQHTSSLVFVLQETRRGHTSAAMKTFIEAYLHPSVLKQMPLTNALVHTLSHRDSEDDVLEMFQLSEDESPIFLLLIIGPTCPFDRVQSMRTVLARYAANKLESDSTRLSKSVRRLVVIPMIDDGDEDSAIQQLLMTVGIETSPVVSLRIFDISTGDVYVYDGATDSGFTVESLTQFCNKVLSGKLAPVDLLATEFDMGEAVAVESGPTTEQIEIVVDATGDASQHSVPDSITQGPISVLFQDATGDDEAEPSLPEEVQDLLGDESVDAFLVAFVSPTAVQTLLAQTQTASGSDKRASLLVNAHFGGLVSRLGQVLGGEENFSSVRGIVDAQGNCE